MLLTDMMEWTHWATRMHPALHAGDSVSAPYTADQRAKIREINSHTTLNTLSRLWQVMVAAVSEMQTSGNQKQCFDMLVVRMMHIAELPSVGEMLKKQSSQPAASKPTVAPVTPKQVKISSATDLAAALQSDKEILLYSYYTTNMEVSEFSDKHIVYFDRGNDSEFATRLTAWLNKKTGQIWTLERATKSEHAQTVTEQKHDEIVSDPMVQDAMNLFEDAEIIGSTK